MIVIVIMTLMMLIGYAPYNFYQQKAKVKIAGREIAQSIYKARNFALSGKSVKNGGDNNNTSILLEIPKNWEQIFFKVVKDLELNCNNIQNFNIANKEFDKKKLQKWVEFNNSSDLKIFFEAVTGKVCVNTSENPINVKYRIKDSSNGSLNQKIQYYPETNTIFYKTK